MKSSPTTPSNPVKGLIELDRKSTRLNSSHSQISYAVFCLKKKKNDTSRTEGSTHKQPSPLTVPLVTTRLLTPALIQSHMRLSLIYATYNHDELRHRLSDAM